MNARAVLLAFISLYQLSNDIAGRTIPADRKSPGKYRIGLPGYRTVAI